MLSQREREKQAKQVSSSNGSEPSTIGARPNDANRDVNVTGDTAPSSARSYRRRASSSSALTVSSQISRGRPSKRPASDDGNRESKRVKQTIAGLFKAPPRSRSQYSNSYLALYNQVVNDIRLGSQETLSASQIGMSKWTEDEKRAMHSLRPWRSTCDRPAWVDSTLCSKSIAQQADFRDALEQGASCEMSQKVAQLQYTQVPAAFELSQECCDALERAADALNLRQGSYEGVREVRKYGQYSVLSQELANELDARLNEGKQLMPLSEISTAQAFKVQRLTPALETFRLSKWLLLSERVFMNQSASPGEGSSWYALTEGRSKPVIYASAFIDFYNLAVSFTRRVCSAGIFQATLRLRKSDQNRRKAFQPTVRKRDVVSALNVLGAAHDTFDFWACAAKRNRLNVVVTQSNTGTSHAYQASHGLVDESELSHAQVERCLGNAKTTRDGDFNDNLSDVSLESSSTSTSMSEPDVQSISASIESEDRQDALNAEADAYLDVFDARNDHYAEKDMWKLLGQRDSTVTRVMQLPRKPNVSLGVAQKHESWRDDVEASAEWEMHGKFLSLQNGLKPSTQRTSGRQQHSSSEHRAQEDVSEMSLVPAAQLSNNRPRSSSSTSSIRLEGTSVKKQTVLPPSQHPERFERAHPPTSSRTSSVVANSESDSDDIERPISPQKPRNQPLRSTRSADPEYAFQPVRGVVVPGDLYSDSDDGRDDYRPQTSRSAQKSRSRSRIR
ncbi:MAG: hypothetical protein M1828_003209 [Chrysothrix sp. TS-e1954]|nr:MAG: hypothetical protein M1828_003209 [Chrysothrix sp. TS-e1954]